MLHHLLYTCIHRFLKENRMLQAAGLTFYTLFSLAPLAALVLSLIGLVSFVPDQSARIEAFFLHHFVPQDSGLIDHYIHSFVQSSAKLSRISTFLFLLTVIFLINNIESCFNEIWHAHAKVVSLRQFFHYAMVLIVSPLLLGLSVGLSAMFLSFKWLQHPLISNGIVEFIKLLPFISTWLAITVLYYWLPQTKVMFKHVLLAAFMVAFLFELMKYGFQWYILLLPTYQIVYGALSLLLIFLLWIYLSWITVLLGAIFASELHQRHHHKIRAKRDLS